MNRFPMPSSELINRLYEGAGSPQALTRLVSEVCSAIGAQQGLIQTSAASNEHRGVNLVAHGVPLQSLVEYHVHFEHEDVWTRAAVQRRLLFEGSVARGAELVPPDVLRGTRFWREFLARHDVVDMISGVLEAPASMSSPPTVVTFHRTGAQAHFSRDDEELLRALLPHIRRLLRLQRRLAPQLALGVTLREVLEDMDVPLALIDSRGHPVSLNQAAKRALERACFLRISASGSLQWRLADQAWHDLTSQLDLLRVVPSAEQLLVAEDGGSCVASLLAVRGNLQALESPASAYACISLRPVLMEHDEDLIRQRFSLTAAEWGVAFSLWRGMDAEAIAEVRELKQSTVRTHIASLLAKTQTDRQIQMLAKLVGKA